jgi:hypothetical protein
MDPVKTLHKINEKKKAKEFQFNLAYENMEKKTRIANAVKKQVAATKKLKNATKAPSRKLENEANNEAKKRTCMSSESITCGNVEVTSGLSISNKRENDIRNPSVTSSLSGVDFDKDEDNNSSSKTSSNIFINSKDVCLESVTKNAAERSSCATIPSPMQSDGLMQSPAINCVDNSNCASRSTDASRYPNNFHSSYDHCDRLSCRGDQQFQLNHLHGLGGVQVSEYTVRNMLERFSATTGMIDSHRHELELQRVKYEAEIKLQAEIRTVEALKKENDLLQRRLLLDKMMSDMKNEFYYR